MLTFYVDATVRLVLDQLCGSWVFSRGPGNTPTPGSVGATRFNRNL